MHRNLVGHNVTILRHSNGFRERDNYTINLDHDPYAAKNKGHPRNTAKLKERRLLATCLPCPDERPTTGYCCKNLSFPVQHLLNTSEGHAETYNLQYSANFNWSGLQIDAKTNRYRQPTYSVPLHSKMWMHIRQECIVVYPVLNASLQSYSHSRR